MTSAPSCRMIRVLPILTPFDPPTHRPTDPPTHRPAHLMPNHLMSKRILNAEQLSAALSDAQSRNPNRDRILQLRDQIQTLSKEVGALVSDDEKYCGLMLLLSTDFDSRSAAAKVMTSPEIAAHLFSLFAHHTENEMDRAILDEALDRLGYGTDEEDEEKAA